MTDQRAEIAALAYIGIRSDRLEDWQQFASGLLGMQQVDRGAHLRSFRMDDRKQRLLVDGQRDGQEFFGWEVVYHADLEKLAARLEAHGHNVTWGSRALAAARMVSDLIVFDDPSGYRIEVCWKPEVTDDPFVPGRPIAGFKTGPLGMGHAVLHTGKIEPMLTFYRDILRFGVTDFGRQPYPLYFFHVNGRHHSFALVGSGQSGMHHFMVELLSLDDVGQGYDLAGLEQDRLAYTLGRHTNDWMTSFYTHSPSRFFVEYGWGAREVDPVDWVTEETFDGPSFWGHERLYLDEKGAKRLRDMRLETATAGKRAMDYSPSCPWANSIIARD
ncbi:MAG: VOC family protein [Pseudomonadota bacterium]